MPALPSLPALARLPWARRPASDPGDISLAGELDERRASAREAEAALHARESAGAPAEEVAVSRHLLDRRLGSALEAAEAAYRVALGPLAGVRRTAYLARLQDPRVRDADRQRRHLALARTHLRVAARDDMGIQRLGSVPPSVGTGALELGTHTSGH